HRDGGSPRRGARRPRRGAGDRRREGRLADHDGGPIGIAPPSGGAAAADSAAFRSSAIAFEKTTSVPDFRSRSPSIIACVASSPVDFRRDMSPVGASPQRTSRNPGRKAPPGSVVRSGVFSGFGCGFGVGAIVFGRPSFLLREASIRLSSAPFRNRNQTAAAAY